MSESERERPDCASGENGSPEHKPITAPIPNRGQADCGQQLIKGDLPKLPEEFTELQLLIRVMHPSLFLDQAQLLKARFDAFIKAGFNEEQAMQLILRWGLKKNLTDS